MLNNSYLINRSTQMQVSLHEFASYTSRARIHISPRPCKTRFHAFFSPFFYPSSKVRYLSKPQIEH